MAEASNLNLPAIDPDNMTTGQKFKHWWKQTWILFMMQFRAKFDTSILHSARKTIVRCLIFVAEFIGIMLLAYLVLWLCRYLNLFSPLKVIPTGVMSVVVFLLIFFSMITCVVSLSKNLFSANDNRILATFPTSAGSIYISKLAMSYIHELKKIFLFFVPIIFAYLLLSWLPFYIYLWVILMLLIFTIVEVLICGFLALPVHYILKAFNRYLSIKLIVILVFVIALIFFVIWIISLIPEDINLITSWTRVSQVLRDFLDWFRRYFAMDYGLTVSLVGRFDGIDHTFLSTYTWLVPAIMAAAIVVFLLINVVISRYAYLQVALSSHEGTSKQRREHKNHRRRGFFSNIYYDSIRLLKSNNNLASIIAVLILVPLIALLLNSIYDAISTRLVGDYLTISFNVFIIVLFTTSSNVYVSSLYSVDANALAMSRTMPTGYSKNLFPRLTIPFIATLLTVLPASFIFLTRANINTMNAIFVMVTECLVCVGHLLWSAQIDFSHPRPDLFATSGRAAINPNEAKSIVSSLVLSLICFGLYFFFLMYTTTWMYLRILIIAAIFFIYRVIIFIFKARTTYREV
ncbi:MAG: hypothetical protein LUC31_02400 [Coprobacillus sp.]|nr:hypothetical protein [Coprobacillus sp.]